MKMWICSVAVIGQLNKIMYNLSCLSFLHLYSPIKVTVYVSHNEQILELLVRVDQNSSKSGGTCSSSTIMPPQDKLLFSNDYLPHWTMNAWNYHEKTWLSTGAPGQIDNLSQLVWNSSCWPGSPWQPRCRLCRWLQASAQSACRRCCLPQQGSPHWSPQESCSWSCSHRFQPGLYPMLLSLCLLSLLWSTG